MTGMPAQPLIRALVDFARSVRHDTLPPDVATECKRILLDSVGCAYAALGTEKGRKALGTARAMAGAGRASVFGCEDRLPAAAAAFANGELINALDFDVCTIPPGHVAPYVLPALLAVAEDHATSGKRLIEAIAVAHELSTRLGRAMSHYRDVVPGQPISFPAVSGYSSTIIGATLACALAQGMDDEATANALGLAAHMAPAQSLTKWMQTLPATDDKYLMAGWMAQAELQALLLASQGYRGNVEILDGDYGFWRFMGGQKWNPAVVTDGLGEHWTFPQFTIYKPYPTCRISHTVLDCLAGLMAGHNLQPQEIEAVTVYCDPHAAVLPMFSNTSIASSGDAAMNVPYAVSMVAHGVPSGPAWHDEGTMRNDTLLAFMRKVTVLPHTGFEAALAVDPQARIGKVEVRTRGQVLQAQRHYRQGSPATSETRMTDEQLLAKFRHCASRVRPDTAGQIGSMIFQLERLDDIGELARLW